MTDLKPIIPEATALIHAYRERGLRIATAESCTGGLIAATLTEIPGSSAVLDRGFVTYSNAAKTDMLGVDAALIDSVGAVSEEVAIAMAEGALLRSLADVAISVTGIAGPDGGTPEKPVGLVHFCGIRRGARPRHRVHSFENLGRESIRFASLRQALALLGELARD